MASSSPSGKGGAGHALEQLDLVRMNQIKSIIRQRARDKSDLKFESIWAKCLCMWHKCQSCHFRQAE